MQILPYKIRALKPPKDNLLSAIFDSQLTLKDGDILAVASKVVSIHEGRCLPVGTISKEKLVEQEAELIVQNKPQFGSRFTVANGVLIRAAGIDESNGDGHYILWPTDPQKSAENLRRALLRRLNLRKLGVIITDSISTPLRRGAIGFALAWAGIDPLYDYRGSKDIFGRTIGFEQQNIADALAAAAVVVMGEGSEQTPLAVIKNPPEKVWKGRHTKADWKEFKVPLRDDLFAQFLLKVKWKKGKGK